MASRAKRIDKKGVCNWVQDIIKARRISIGEFCKLGGVGRTDASAFMSYRKYPTRKQVESICAAFGEDSEDILYKYNYKIATATAKETVEEESAMDIVTNANVEPVAVVETKVDEPKKYDKSKIQKNALTRAGFSTWLETELAERKLNSHTLAKATGACQPQICKYVRGKAYPDINTLDKLCTYFGYNTISVACVFKYQRFEEASTWLGENYWEDDDYRMVYSLAFPHEKKKAESTMKLESIAVKLEKEDVDSRTDLSPISSYSEEKTKEVLERADESQGYFTSSDVVEELGLKPNLVSNFLSKKPVGPVEAKIESVTLNKLSNPVDVFIECVVTGLQKEVKGSVSGYYEDGDVVFKITAPGLPDIQKRISFNVESVVDEILSNYRDAVMAAYFKEV